MLTETQIRETATNLRKLASDPKLKKRFTSAARKSFNDDANEIMAALVTMSENRPPITESES